MSILMPTAKFIHYKCAFDIEENGITVKDIKDIIKEWCRVRRDFKQNEYDSILRDWFLYGDTEQHLFGKCYIKTALNKGRYTKDNPQHWAFELIHQDSEYSHRLWCTNISISHNDNNIRFACLLSHALQPYYIGDEPAIPKPSVPRFIKNIIKNDNIHCSKNKIKIEGKCYDAAVFGSQWLANLICNKERVMPIIVSVNTTNLEKYDTISELIHENNIGNANIYKITDTETLSGFNSAVPYDHRLSNGMIRVFLRFKDAPNSGRFHRFYTSEQVQEKKEEDIVNEITCGISRRSLAFYPEEVISIQDVIDKRRLENLEEIKNNINYDKDEYIKLLEYELEEKSKEIKEIKENFVSEQDRFENELIEAYTSLDEKETTCKKLRYEATQYPILTAKIAKLETQKNTDIDFSLPESLSNVLALAKKFYENRIIIHEKAIRSANNYSGSSNIKIMSEAWRMLSRLNDTMYDLKFIQNSNELESAFFEKTAIKFSMTESSTTKADKKFTNLRTCTYNINGKLMDITFFPHLKSSVRDDFRLHFSFLEEEKKILVCHCGQHIDNAKTKHIS